LKTTGSKLFYILNFVIILSALFCPTALAGKPARVLIVPFNIHSEKDLSFLKSGIQDMLSTRLVYKDQIVPLSREEVRQVVNDMPATINEKVAVSLGAKLQADYVAFGSLTVFGDSISTDAKFIDVHKQKPLVIFNQAGQNHSDVIAHINLFAQQINEKVFGRKTVSHQPPRPAPQKEIADSTRRHPETRWTSETGTGADYAPAAEGKGGVDIWKSRRFRTKINGLTIGDVTGDGSNETVFISENTVHIFRYSNGRFVRVSELKGQSGLPYIAVDVADINHNGKAEIFVTQFLESTKTLDSFVVEWNGAEFIKIQDHLKWYFTVLNLPERGGKVLLGQKQGLEDLFGKSGVYELEWINAGYEPGQRQILPKNINIYGFTYGDVFNNGREAIVAFTNDDYLQVYDQGGDEDWTSSQYYGGNALYIDTPSPDDPGDSAEDKRTYMKQRIHIADLDKDGKNEVIVVNNQDYANRLLSRVRTFKSGHIECLAWDILGLHLKWRTRKITGYISDYAIGDLNNDGRDELVFSAIAKTNVTSVKSRSYIATWSIQTPSP